MEYHFLPLTQRVKFILTSFLLLASIGLTAYFHIILQKEIVFTHFLYIPIILAAFWYRKKGIWISFFLALVLMSSHHLFLSSQEFPYDEIMRSIMFIIVSVFVAVLADKLISQNTHLHHTIKELDLAHQMIVNQEKRALVGELTAGLIHEVKNQLCTISLLKVLETPLNDSDKKSIDLIFESRERMIDLFKEVSALAKNEQQEYPLQSYPLRSVIEESIAIIKMDSEFQNTKKITSKIIIMEMSSSIETRLFRSCSIFLKILYRQLMAWDISKFKLRKKWIMFR